MFWKWGSWVERVKWVQWWERVKSEVKADIKRGAEKKGLKFVQLHERERESGEYSRLIGEDQIFNNLDCLWVYGTKQFT